MERHFHGTMSSVTENSNFFALCTFIVSLGLLVHGGDAVVVCKTPEQIRWVSAGNTRYKCLNCPDCPAGSQPSVPCGNMVPYGTAIDCVSCKLGETYSDTYGKDQCKSCTVCSEGRAVKKNCTLSWNTECDNKCTDGYYREAFIFRCLNCVECCGDENDELASECANGPKKCKVRSLSCDKKNTKASKAATNGRKASLLVNQQNETSTVFHTTRTTEKEMGVDAHNQPANQPTPSGGSFSWDPRRQEQRYSTQNNREAEEGETEDDGNKVLILASLLPFTTIAVVLVLIFFCMIRQGKLQQYCQASGRAGNDRAVPVPLETIASSSQEMIAEKFKTATVDSCNLLISCGDSYSVPAASSTKLRAGSLTIQSGIDFDLEPSFKYPGVSSQIRDIIVEALKDDEDATLNDLSCRRKENHKRRNSSLSYKSTSSETSRMLWDITNLPENIDPNMVAWGLVDHNGGKFTIGNTGVSLIVPPQAIPEGHTEGIFIAIVNQEEGHPQLGGKEALLSPVVKCGPNGIKFQRPVILSMPHCALLENGAWNLKVQYNENEPGVADDWKQLTDANNQDGSVSNLVLLEADMVHLIIDHFTNFVMKGESASSQVVAKKSVRIVAYVTPPETSEDCIVRVYCVGDTPVHLEMVHYEETERLGGIRVDAPKPFDFRNGGGDLLVKLTDHHRGWIHTTADMKRIRFQHIWDGIERMPSCSSAFTMRDEFVSQFRATFEVEQDCQDGDEQEVIVSTAIKQRQSSVSEKSKSNNKATEQTCTVTSTVSGNMLKGTSENSLQETTASDLLGAVAASPLQMAHTSSGYFSFGFEPSPALDSLPQRIRSELIIYLDPPHPKADWRTLAEGLDFKMKYIRFLESLKPPASPTDTLLNILEAKKFPLCELAERLHGMGREDAAAILEEALVLRETNV
ncbi:netrin receptor UNC5D-like [Montipora capricornis]|uniref:netrin receptor UNC5D-like n=1 Tax=Montipora capricornis TaxID=246305 RepID=UPI0035F1DEEA